MNGIFVVLFLISLISVPVVIIKPHLLEKITMHQFTRLKAGLLSGGIAMALFVLVGATAPLKPTNNVIVSQNQQAKEAAKQGALVDEGNKAEKTSTTPAPQANLYTVVSVIDGDTIQVLIDTKKETLRLIGIDTPETVDPRKSVQCFGKEASAKAKALLSGKPVRLESDPTQGERDKYQRLLRYVFLEDGTNFNKLMISEGFAHEYTYNIPYKYQTEFKQAQKEAEAAKKGLWADDACLTATPQSTAAATTTNTSVTTSGSSNTNGNFTCAGKTTCGQMASCAEAKFYLNTCGVSRLDGDKDGVPCESLCN